MRSVILPLTKPALVTAAMWHFVGCWAEFAFASVLLLETPSNKTVTIGLASSSIISRSSSTASVQRLP
jgi:multiple sugar transport system permease protein